VEWINLAQDGKKAVAHENTSALGYMKGGETDQSNDWKLLKNNPAWRS
jgi:hypothetical protein